MCSLALLTVTNTNIGNLSLASGVFPDQSKSSSVQPLLKIHDRDENDVTNCRQISDLSFLCKLTDLLVESHPDLHASNSLS